MTISSSPAPVAVGWAAAAAPYSKASRRRRRRLSRRAEEGTTAAAAAAATEERRVESLFAHQVGNNWKTAAGRDSPKEREGGREGENGQEKVRFERDGKRRQVQN